jgi:hypothetical protein
MIPISKGRQIPLFVFFAESSHGTRALLRNGSLLASCMES